MPHADIVSFDPSASKLKSKPFGYDRLLVTGKDIFVYSDKTARGDIGHPAIFSSSNADLLVQLAKRFDIIHHQTYEASPALMTKIAAKGKRVLISLHDILSRHGADRAKTMHRISRFVEFCKSYKAHFIIASMADTDYGLRSPQEISDIMKPLGLTSEQVRFSMSTISELRIRKVMD